MGTRASLAIALLSGFCGCHADVDYGGNSAAQPIPVQYDSVSLNFTEPNTTAKQLDILFVIHATSSFDQQLATNVANGLPGMITGLSGIDYQIGVILAYPGGAQSGVLFNAAANTTAKIGPVLAGSKLSVAQMQNALMADFSSAPSASVTLPVPVSKATPSPSPSVESVVGEYGSLSLLNAFHPATLAATRSKQGFFRPGAGLAVIFVANESDGCFIASNDTDADEQRWKREFCSGVSIRAVINAVNAAAAGNPTMFGFIGYATDPVDSKGKPIDEQEKGRGYYDIVKSAGGIAASLDPSNHLATASQMATIVGDGLTAFGALASRKFQLTTTFPLWAGALSSSLELFMNDIELKRGQDYHFDAGTHSVSIPKAAPQAQIVINYQAPAPMPSPSPSPSAP